MIPISEVIEEAARECDSVSPENPMTASDCAEAIRSLAVKYEGCIVAEDEPDCYISTEDGWPRYTDGESRFPLYRARGEK
jgi:hypothetical protein